MAGAIGGNVAQLVLQVTSRGVESFTKVNNELKGLNTNANTATGRIGGFQGAMSRVLPIITKLAGPVALAGAALALKNITTNVINTTDELNVLGQRLNLSAPAIQSLAANAELAGSNISEVETALISFNVQVGRAREGLPSTIKAFDDLGVSLEGPNGELKSTEQLARESFTALSNLEDPAIRASIGATLLGESSAKLNPLIDQGTEAFEGFRQGLTQDFADAASEFTGTQSKIGFAINEINTELTKTLLPAFQDIASAILDVINSGQDWSPLTNAISTFASIAGDAVVGLIQLIGGIATVVNQAVGFIDMLVRSDVERAISGGNLETLRSKLAETNEEIERLEALPPQRGSRLNSLRNEAEELRTAITTGEEKAAEALISFDAIVPSTSSIATNTGTIATNVKNIADNAVTAETSFKDGVATIEGQIIKLSELKSEQIGLLDETERKEALNRIAQQNRERERTDALRAIHTFDQGELDKLTEKYNAEVTPAADNAVTSTEGIGTAASDASTAVEGIGTSAESVVPKITTLRDLIGLDATRNSIRSAIAGLISGTNSWSQAFDSVGRSIQTNIINKLAELATNSVFNALGLGNGAAGLGSIGSALGSIGSAASALGSIGGASGAAAGASGAAAAGASGAAAGASGVGAAATTVLGAALGAAPVIGVGAALYGALTPTAGTSTVGTLEGDLALAQERVKNRQEVAERAREANPRDFNIIQRVINREELEGQPRLRYNDLKQRRDVDPAIQAYLDATNDGGLRRRDPIVQALAYRFFATRQGLPEDRSGRVTSTGRGFSTADYARAFGIIQGYKDPSKPYQDGGIVTRETRAIIGEAGPEAIVPLPNGRSIPVQFQDGGGSSTQVNFIVQPQGNFEEDVLNTIRDYLSEETAPGGSLAHLRS